MYVLYGENVFEINKYIDELLRKENILDKIIYDYEETGIDEVINEAMYDDLFSSKKAIILDNSLFLTSKSTLDNELFNKYINNPNENTILIFKVIVDKLDERKKIVKDLKTKAIVKEFVKLEEKNMPSYIKNYFNEINYKIDNDSINEIVRRINTHTEVLNNELDKLRLLKIKDKEIALYDVKNTIITYENDNDIFKLVDAVINNDKAKIFNLYKDLIDNKVEPLMIITLIANQLRLILNTSIFLREGFTKDKIASKLKEHPYRIQLSIEKTYKISNKKLEDLLYQLSVLDLQIKSGEVDKVKGLEMFFLSL